MKYDPKKEDGCIQAERSTKDSEDVTCKKKRQTISNTLHQVHKPYDQRSTEDTKNHSGTILFDLT